MTQMRKCTDAASCCPSDFDGLFPTELFRALSDGNRIALLAHLATGDGPQTVTEAAGCCPTDISVTSRHLSVLRDAGIVDAEKQGRQVLYSVRYEQLSRALRQMADVIDSCCPAPESEKSPSDG
jgi:DNA-binding transcriptional ArsR family regulator